MVTACLFIVLLSLEIQNCIINHTEILRQVPPWRPIQAKKDLFQSKSRPKYTFFKPKEKKKKEKAQ